MMAKKSRLFMCLFLAVFLFTAFVPVSGRALQEESEQESQAAEKEVVEKTQAEEKKTEQTNQNEEEVADVIVPSPKDHKEAMGIYVFLTWIWLSIGVLIYILRLKVKETDRIYRLKFFSKDKT